MYAPVAAVTSTKWAPTASYAALSVGFTCVRRSGMEIVARFLRIGLVELYCGRYTSGYVVPTMGTFHPAVCRMPSSRVARLVFATAIAAANARLLHVIDAAREEVVAADGDRDEPDVPPVPRDEPLRGRCLGPRRVCHRVGTRSPERAPGLAEDARRGRAAAREVLQDEVVPLGRCESDHLVGEPVGVPSMERAGDWLEAGPVGIPERDVVLGRRPGLLLCRRTELGAPGRQRERDPEPEHPGAHVPGSHARPLIRVECPPGPSKFLRPGYAADPMSPGRATYGLGQAYAV